MVGQVIRAVEVPISLSVGVARRGAVLAGRVAGWAVTGIVRELSPDKRENRPAPATDDSPLAEEPGGHSERDRGNQQHEEPGKRSHPRFCQHPGPYEEQIDQP